MNDVFLLFYHMMHSIRGLKVFIGGHWAQRNDSGIVK